MAVTKKRASKGCFICKQCRIEFPNSQKGNSLGICLDCKTKEENFKRDEAEFMRHLMDYCGLETVTGMIRSQFKRYVAEGYKIGGMKYTLYYCKEIERLDLDFKTYGIGFVAYNYTKAQDYFTEQQRLQNTVPKGFKIEKKVVEFNRTKVSEPRKLTIDLDNF